MEKAAKKHFGIKLFIFILVLAGIMAYAYLFPTTMELLDGGVNKLLDLVGEEGNFEFFSKLSSFANKAVNEILYWAELIKDNAGGIFENAKPVSSIIISCAAAEPSAGEQVTSAFGSRISPITGKTENHSGIDIAAPFGSEVTAAWPGTVFETGFDEIYGNYIVLRHSEEFFTKYCHLSKIGCSEGEFANSGEVIGEAGSTGWSTGSHLHFEVTINGMNIDPKECFES